jgi:hypothetical protein
VRCSVKDDFGEALQGPSAALATARDLTIPLSIRFPLSPSPNFVPQQSASATRSASVGIAVRWWIGGITRIVLPAHYRQ